MPKLKLGPILDDRPVKLSVELPAELHRDFVAYAEALSRETGQQVEPTKLVAPMLARFLASDRGFRSASRPAARASTQLPQPTMPPRDPEA
jgi:hypothetical protein